MNDTCCDKCANSTGLCCCMSSAEYKKVDLAEVVQNDKRRCTDIPFCCLLFACIVIEILIIVSAAKSGADPLLLLHGTNYNGQLCDGETNGKYTVWPSLQYFDIRICSDLCNAFTNDIDNTLMIDNYKSEPFLNSYCLPNIDGLKDSVDSNFDNLSGNIQRGLADLYTTKWLILIMSFVAIVISFIYLKLISFLSRILTYFTAIMVLITGVTFSWLLFQNGLTDYSLPETQHIGFIEIILSLIVIIILFCLFLALWFSRNKIELVFDMLKEANHAIYDMKLTLIFPIWMSLLGIMYIIYWTIETLYIYSVKTTTIQPMPDIFINDGGQYPATYHHIEFNYDLMKDELIWHFIILFYSVEVIIYFGYMVLAGVFSDWYFSKWTDDNHKKYKQRGDDIAQLSHSPICESIWRVTRYHLGTLAFGALIITIIRMMQGFVQYIKKKTEKAQNPFTKCIFCIVTCCLKCCECIFNRINKNGFIFTSIYGTAFCYSSYQSLHLILENLGKTFLMTGISKYTEQFGRFIISLLNTGIALLVMKYNTYYYNNLGSYLFPSIIIFIVSYIISALFMMVFDVGVETIFLCFLIDETVNNGQPKFATDEMKQLVDQTASFSQRNKKSTTSTNDGTAGGNIQTYTQI